MFIYCICAHPQDNGSPKRKCKYGTSCYQKNPEHLAKYDHSGDSEKSPGSKVRELECQSYGKD